MPWNIPSTPGPVHRSVVPLGDRFQEWDTGFWRESWGTGGCVATHGQEVARRQRLTDRYPGMFVLCGVVPGAPDGVPDCCLQREVYHFSYTAGMLHCQAASSRWDIVRSHHVLRWYYIVPHVQWVAGLCRLVAFWRVPRFSRKTWGWWWAGHWWTHRDGEFQCWYLILARRL